MPTYEYRDCVSGRTREVQQRISDKPFTHYDTAMRQWLTIDAGVVLHANPQVVHPVLRVISGGTGFHLKGDCWASDGYSK